MKEFISTIYSRARSTYVRDQEVSEEVRKIVKVQNMARARGDSK